MLRGGRIRRDGVTMPWVKIRAPKIRTVVLRLVQLVCGVVGLVLFWWIPATGRGLAIYGILLVVLVAVIVMISPKREGYWPHPPQNSK
jgi:type IV secretory pathway TrbD component